MSWLTDLLLPHFFVKEPLLEITNTELAAAINQVKKSDTLETAIKLGLSLIAERFDSKRFETYLSFYKLYEKDPNVLWQRPGFMHCTHQNYLLRVLLVKSGWVKDKDIELGFSLIWYISPHQYLKIRVPNGQQVAADPWNYNLGATYGHYASGFGVKKLD